MNTQEQENPRREQAESDESEENAQSRNGESASHLRATEEDEKLHFTLTETAELHGVSKSYLSRRVKAGKPAKGYDLTGNVQVARQRIQGFEFSPDYEFPDGRQAGEVAGRPGEIARADTEGEGAGHSGTGDNGPLSEKDINRPEESEIEEEVPSERSGHSRGFASTTEDLYLGQEVWGTLQRVRDGGEEEFLRSISPAKSVTIDWVSETYGAGRYRISRMEEGQKVHLQFRVSRQSPSAVERRLARTDQLEHRIEELNEELQKKEERNRDLEERLSEKKSALTETESQIEEEQFARKKIKRERDRLAERVARLKDETERLSKREEERREKKRELRKQAEERREKLREKVSEKEEELRSLREEKRSLKLEHTKEAETLKNRVELKEKQLEIAQEVAEREGGFERLVKAIFDQIGENPEMLKALGERFGQWVEASDLGGEPDTTGGQGEGETRRRGATGTEAEDEEADTDSGEAKGSNPGGSAWEEHRADDSESA